MTQLISATFIHANSGDKFPALPAQLFPDTDERLAYMHEHQLKGTPMEQLCEIAGRACYDSFGRGRTTPDFHKHILEVGHLSVIEHANFTVRIDGMDKETLIPSMAACLNKPSLFTSWEGTIDAKGEVAYSLVITCNLRHVLEWRDGSRIGLVLRHYAHEFAPQIVGPAEALPTDLGFTHELEKFPDLPQQHWLTFFLTGSRGFSHELVRHGDWTAISQRSTRYVDESQSQWVDHPLVVDYLGSSDKPARAPNGEQVEFSVAQEVGHVNKIGKRVYGFAVEKLEPWLVGRGVDKTTARKQARGAARGYLGNALYTEVVFSASVAQWIHMIKMRANPAADAEIREVFTQVVEELQKPGHKGEPWAKFFADIKLAPSPDGIGRIAVFEETKAATA